MPPQMGTTLLARVHDAGPLRGGPRTLDQVADRIVSAAAACIARNGVARTTIDDVARSAGCSRATVYRVFPGGKDAVVGAAAVRELTTLLTELGDELAGCATLEDAVVLAISSAVRRLRTHAGLQRVVAGESDLLLPWLSFGGLEPLLAGVADFAAAHLCRFVDTDTARMVGEWAGRVVLGALVPEPPAPVVGNRAECWAAISAASAQPPPLLADPPAHLTDPAATRRFVRTFLLPALEPPGAPVAHPTPSPRLCRQE